MDLPAPPRALIKTLPAETLVAVFSKVTNEPNLLMRLALVCRSWRDMVFGSGALWYRITVDRRITEGQLRRHLDLSGEALLTLDLESSVPLASSRLVWDWNYSRPIRERVRRLSRSRKFYRFDIGLEGHDWPQLKELELESLTGTVYLHLRAPNLEKLELRGSHVHYGDNVDLSPTLYNAERSGSGCDTTTFLQAAAHYPNLRRLALNEVATKILARPKLPALAPFWPTLAEMTVQCPRAVLTDVLAIISNAPHLSTLDLKFDKLLGPASPTMPARVKSSPCLQRLSIEFVAEPEDQSEHVLRSALLQCVFNCYDTTVLKSIKFRGAAIPRSGIPELCPQLQMVHLEHVVLPHGFVEGLNQCPLIRHISISGCKVRDVSPSVGEKDASTMSLVFNGDTFIGAFEQLQTLKLYEIVAHPDFVAHLAHYSHLEDVVLDLYPMRLDPHTAPTNWLDVETVMPLPNLRRFYIGLDLWNERQSLLYSFVTPEARQIMSTAAQLAHGMPSGKVIFESTPLRTTDIERLIFNPHRVQSSISFNFKTGAYRAGIIHICFATRVGLSTDKAAWFKIQVGIEETELGNVVDMIWKRLPLDSDTVVERFDEGALIALQAANKESPDVVVLQYLLRRAGVTASD